MRKYILFSLVGLLFLACSTSDTATREKNNGRIPEVNLLEVDYYSESEIDNNVLPTSLMADLRRRVGYPVEARKRRLEGRVEVEALITKEGNAYITSLKSRVHPILDNQVINAVKETNFVPGTLNGKPVNVLVTIPVDFKLAQ